MPLTDLQKRVLRLLAANRNPDSYLAGASVIHRGDESPRFSEDLDFFHDLTDSIAVSAERDSETLRRAGYEVEWILRTPTFQRAILHAEGNVLKLEWAHDSAFRFFPVEPDSDCGYRLHIADASTNKILALAGRQEIRDFVDVLHLDQTYLSLGALTWAACGKDPGFTPEFLLDQLNRHSGYAQADLDRLNLTAPMDIKKLKVRWLNSMETARRLVESLPPEEIGCLYTGDAGCPVVPDPASPVFRILRRHFGSIKGAWPIVEQA